MMKSLFPLLLSLLLLCGCAAQSPEPEPVPVQSLPTEEAIPLQPSLTMTVHSDKEQLKQYTLSEDVTGFLLLEENLLFFSGTDTTTLTLLSTQTGVPAGVHSVPFTLTPENASVQLLEKGISYFNENSRETVVLDSSLREVRRIAAPEDLTGVPLLSRDRRILYYCTPDAVRCLDLDTGISRILKEASYPRQHLSGVLLDGTVLQVHITDTDGSERTLFLSPETGQLLADLPETVCLETKADRFFLCRQEGELKTLLFGSSSAAPMMLQPRNSPENHFFLGKYVITAACQDSNTLLELYELDPGRCCGTLTLDPRLSPTWMAIDADGKIWILLGQETGPMQLWYWDPAVSPQSDSSIYTVPYYTREEPDYEGLAACSLYAQELSQKHGIQILIYKDAAAQEPWDYHLSYEYQPAVLRRELDALDLRLSLFPEGFLQTLTDKFTELTFCIVRSAEGSPESGSPEAVNGLQFLDGFDAYIVLATSQNTEYALYHELSHLMETVILTESVAFDRWDNLNPPDFRYDNDYAANQTRDGTPWLQPGKAYFIDTYSMYSAKEDRARLFEYAMTDGHEALFRSPKLQDKLRQLSTGIREGFGLEDYSAPLPWEQYLTAP